MIGTYTQKKAKAQGDAAASPEARRPVTSKPTTWALWSFRLHLASLQPPSCCYVLYSPTWSGIQANTPGLLLIRRASAPLFDALLYTVLDILSPQTYIPEQTSIDFVLQTALVIQLTRLCSFRQASPSYHNNEAIWLSRAPVHVVSSKFSEGSDCVAEVGIKLSKGIRDFAAEPFCMSANCFSSQFRMHLPRFLTRRGTHRTRAGGIQSRSFYCPKASNLSIVDEVF